MSLGIGSLASLLAHGDELRLGLRLFPDGYCAFCSATKEAGDDWFAGQTFLICSAHLGRFLLY
jgi:hypothetical protein